MNVHFSAPLQDIAQHLDKYQLITSTIEKSGHALVNNWLKGGKSKQTHFSDKEWGDINSDTLASIMAADVIIIEASTPSFSMGYIAAQALAQKKPLLLLFEVRTQPYILDTNNSLKRTGIYKNNRELEQIVAAFLKDNDTDAKDLRFNMVLDRESYNLLQWESVHTGKTKAQIIREMIKDHSGRNQA